MIPPHLLSDAPVRLMTWYDANRAELPWRGADAYGVWLSEIMLQQTRIETVLSYYKRFRLQYPTIYDLASAPLDDVLKLWEGLGYYSRARNLHRAAQLIVTQYGGEIPADLEQLLALPGIGRYTAGAIASIAFGIQAPLLDGNVMRVFARWLDLAEDITDRAVQQRLWQVAEALVPAERPGDYNQALMELGQKICTPRNPSCSLCPVRELCNAATNGTQDMRPVKKKRAPTPHYDVAAGIIRDEQGRILIAQRKAEGLLGGLWEFPGGKQEAGETLPQTLRRELQEEMAIGVEVGAFFVQVKHAFTHFRITLHAYECRYLGALPPYSEPQTLDCAAWAWVQEEELERYSFGKADREVIEALRQRRGMLF